MSRMKDDTREMQGFFSKPQLVAIVAIACILLFSAGSAAYAAVGEQLWPTAHSATETGVVPADAYYDADNPGYHWTKQGTHDVKIGEVGGAPAGVEEVVPPAGFKYSDVWYTDPACTPGHEFDPATHVVSEDDADENGNICLYKKLIPLDEDD